MKTILEKTTKTMVHLQLISTIPQQVSSLLFSPTHSRPDTPGSWVLKKQIKSLLLYFLIYSSIWLNYSILGGRFSRLELTWLDQSIFIWLALTGLGPIRLFFGEGWLDLTWFNSLQLNTTQLFSTQSNLVCLALTCFDLFWFMFTSFDFIWLDFTLFI